MGGPHGGDRARGPPPGADAVQKEEGYQKAGGQENGKAGEKQEHCQEKVDKNDHKDDIKELKG